MKVYLRIKKLPPSLSTNAADNLAFGHVSPIGISEIADLTGVSTAIEMTENEQERGFIARLLPQLLRKLTSEIFWTTRQTRQGIEGRFFCFAAADSRFANQGKLGSVAGNEF